MNILAVESSCDETAASVVEDGRRVLSSVVASQVEEHKIYGGVVPEIASRRHAEAISSVVSKALSDCEMSLSDVYQDILDESNENLLKKTENIKEEYLQEKK